MADAQPSMFRMNGEASAFVTVAANPRQPLIERAYERADDKFLEQYESFLLFHASLLTDFIANEITTGYVQRYGAISKTEKKSLGGLYQRLMKRGLIEKTGGYRERDQGNASAIYRLKR